MIATRPILVCAAVGCAVMTADVASKAAITTVPGLDRLPFVLPVQNSGYLLGAGSGMAPGLVSLGLVLLIAWRMLSQVRKGKMSALAVGLVLGGCVANVSERLVRGAVTDFIRLPWIVLDVADVAVLIGLLVLAVMRTRLVQPAVG